VRPSEYDDGLDTDGYPIDAVHGLAYRHGEEVGAPVVVVPSRHSCP
jgi:hypothetical protein